MPTAPVVRWGHARWDIENQGFNELVNGWYADHVYKHEPQAMEAFLLTLFLAYNLFHGWLTRNLKPCNGVRPGSSGRGGWQPNFMAILESCGEVREP